VDSVVEAESYDGLTTVVVCGEFVVLVVGNIELSVVKVSVVSLVNGPVGYPIVLLGLGAIGSVIVIVSNVVGGVYFTGEVVDGVVVVVVYVVVGVVVVVV